MYALTCRKNDLGSGEVFFDFSEAQYPHTESSEVSFTVGFLSCHEEI
jgi:hypothetical protein